MSNIKINEQILFLRKERGITQEQLSSTLGVSNQAVSKWESGQCCPDITLLPDIAKYFDISVDELLGYERSDNTNNIIFDLRNTLKALPHGEDHRFALKAAYILHALILSKGMEDPRTNAHGWDTERTLEKGCRGDWGSSCVNLPNITTCMQKGSVFYSDNKDFHLNNCRVRNICHLLDIFSDIKNLKTLFAVYSLTVHSEDAHVSITEISEKSGLADGIVASCLENEIYEYLHEIKTSDGMLYRIDGMYMHIPPLLSMFCNIK